MNDKLILLVEDNPDDEVLTLRALKKSNIINQVAVVRDGAEALDFLFGDGQYASRDLAKVPELILLDLNLPKIDGIEVLRRLRADDTTLKIPVVVLTTSRESSDIEECYEVGANSFIQKPVDFDQFTDAIHQLSRYWLGLNCSMLYESGF